MNRKSAIETLRRHLPDLDAAAIPTKCEVFTLCGPAARAMYDAIITLTNAVDDLEAENFKLAAGACEHRLGNEHGNAYCGDTGKLL